MSNLAIERVDAEIRQLPSLSLTVTEALALIDRGDTQAGQLEQVIGRDQALAARILRVANSPFYGFAGHIGSLRQACVILGMYAVRNIVVTAGVIARFPPTAAGRFDRLGLWRHAIGTGVAARVLAQHRGLDPDLAFTAGLLHDIGKLALDAVFPEAFGQVLAHRDKHDCLLRDAEAAVLGFDHTDVGARVARHWKLPTTITEAIAKHHSPDVGPASVIVDVVHLADVLARGLDIGDGGDNLIPRLSTGALGRLTLNFDDLDSYLPEIEEMNAGTNLLDNDGDGSDRARPTGD